MKAKRTTKKEISDVLDFISGFETGDFSKQLGQTDDPILQPIIDKLNTAAKVLAAQADTSFIIDSLKVFTLPGSDVTEPHKSKPTHKNPLQQWLSFKTKLFLSCLYM